MSFAIQLGKADFPFTQGDMTADTVQYEVIKMYQFLQAEILSMVKQINDGDLGAASDTTDLSLYAKLTDLNALRQYIQTISPGAFDPAGSAATAQTNAEAFATAADTTVLATAEAFATAADVVVTTATEAFATSAVATALATALLKANNLSDVASIPAARVNLLNPTQGSGISGAINIDFTKGATIYTLSGNVTLSSANLLANRETILILRNTSGGTLTISWPSYAQGGPSPLPTSISNGTSFQLFLYSTGTTDAGVIFFFCVAGTGTVTGPGTTTTGNVALWNNGTGTLLKDGGTLGSAAFSATSAYDASGAAAAAQAAAIAASYPALGKIPPSSPNNKMGWLGRYFVEDYASLQLAFTAACTGNGVLFLPPGSSGSGTITWPTNFAGTVQIKGCGVNVSTIAASLQLVSTGSPVVSLEDFACTGGIAIDLTSSSYPNGNNSGNVSKVNVSGSIAYASTTNALYLDNCGQMVLDAITLLGSTNTAGVGLNVQGCSNLQASNIQIWHWGKGLNIGLGPTGHQYTNFRVVDCQYGIYATLDVNQGFFMSCWMIDNGNAPSTFTTPPVYIQGASTGTNALNLSNGEILKLGGGSSSVHAIELYDVAHAAVHALDCTFASYTDYAIYMGKVSVGTINSTISQCSPSGTSKLVKCDTGTSGNRAQNNAAGSTFSDVPGTNFLVN